MAAALVTYRLQGGKIVEARVGVGGAEPRPRRIAEAEAALNGKAPGDAVFRAAAEAAASGRSIRWRIIRPRANTGATWCARWYAPRAGAIIAPRRSTGSRTATERAAPGLKWVGRAIRRLEDPALVTGQGRFTADLPAAHWVRFVRSPVAAGKIRSIDAPDGRDGDHRRRSRGREADHADAAQVQLQAGRPAGPGRRRGALRRRAGRRRGRRRARKRPRTSPIWSRSTIDETTPVIDARAALAPARRRCMPKRPATSSSKASSRRPISMRVWDGAHKIVTVEARSRRQNATPMEARAGHAAYDAATGRVTLTCTTQMPHLTRTAIADVLGMPESDLRVIAPDVGGGFGQKMSLAAEYVVLVWLARKLKSSRGLDRGPAREPDRRLSCRDQYITLEGAFDTERQAARRCSADIVSNVGAYSCFPTTCGVEPLMAMAEMPGPYDVRHYDCLARGVITNTCTMAPYRGVSRPVITFTLERLMDKAATRLRHRPGRYPPPQPDRQVPLHLGDGPGVRRGELQRDAGDGGRRPSTCRPSARGRSRRAPRAAISASALRRFPSAPATAARLSPRAAWRSRPAGRPSILTVDPSGFVEARIGSSPHGQGLRTTLAQIIADEIGVDARRDQGRAWRHRPRALRLGHLRQPLAGDFRRRHADRGAEGARQADQDRQPPAGGGARRHRAGGRRGQGRRHRPLRLASPRWRARPTTRPTASRARSSRA